MRSVNSTSNVITHNAAIIVRVKCTQCELYQGHRALKNACKFTETSSPSVQPTCCFKQSRTSAYLESSIPDQMELACREYNLSRHFVRDEVPTNFQSLVTEEPNSSIPAEYRGIGANVTSEPSTVS